MSGKLYNQTTLSLLINLLYFLSLFYMPYYLLSKTGYVVNLYQSVLNANMDSTAKKAYDQVTPMMQSTKCDGLSESTLFSAKTSLF